MRGPATRARRIAPAKELSLHMSVAALLRRGWPANLIWFHCPNGERRDKATAGKLKGMGVLPGVPDFVFVMPNGQAAFLELKARAGETSPAQDDFCDRAKACGCAYAVARSMEDVETILTRWLGAYGLKLRCVMVRRPDPAFALQGGAA